jgi:FkbM family methyltransferase
VRSRFSRQQIYGALYKLKVSRRLNFYPRRKLSGAAVTIPVLGGTGLSNLGRHEPWINKVIGALLPLRAGCFLDVGVNIGQTLLKVIAHDFEREYYGFEPNPRCLGYVEQLIAVNRIPNAKLIPAALSDYDGVIKLFFRHDHDKEASIVPENRGADYYQSSRYIPCVHGDALIERLGVRAASILKIDVEGAELEVLRGCAGTLKTMRPFVLCEILPVYDEISDNGRRRRARTDQTLQIFAEAAYDLFGIPRHGPLRPLDTIPTHGDLKQTDYLFVPRELTGTLPKTLLDAESRSERLDA